MTPDPLPWILWGIVGVGGVLLGGFGLYEWHCLRRSDDRHEPLTFWLRRLFHTTERSSAGRLGRVLLLFAAAVLIFAVVWLVIHLLTVGYI